MATNRWQVIGILVGGALLLLMLLTAAFALGVYVGEHGWTDAGLNYQRPGGGGGPPAGNPAPNPPPAGLPPGPPTVTGRLRRVTGTTLSLATPDGPRAVTITQATRFLDAQGQPISLQDLKPGDVVAVFGRLEAGDGGQLQAETVVQLPPRPPNRPGQ